MAAALHSDVVGHLDSLNKAVKSESKRIDAMEQKQLRQIALSEEHRESVERELSQLRFDIEKAQKHRNRADARADEKEAMLMQLKDLENRFNALKISTDARRQSQQKQNQQKRARSYSGQQQQKKADQRRGSDHRRGSADQRRGSADQRRARANSASKRRRPLPVVHDVCAARPVRCLSFCRGRKPLRAAGHVS